MRVFFISVFVGFCLTFSWWFLTLPEGQKVEGEVVNATYSHPDIFPPYRGFSVEFKDGRLFTFWGKQPDPRLTIGKFYEIKFDRDKNFVEAKEVDKKAK